MDFARERESAPMMSDEMLLRAHVAGDARAFARLVERHGARLWRVARRVVDDDAAAAEAVQDALLRAHRRAADYRGASSVATWLHRIVVNAAHDQRRRTARGRLHPMDPEALAALDRARAAATGPPPDAALPLVLAEALAELPEQWRETVVEVDLRGWSPRELARATGVPPGTVKSRCWRARRELRRYLGECGEPAGRSTGGVAVGCHRTD